LNEIITWRGVYRNPLEFELVGVPKFAVPAIPYWKVAVDTFGFDEEVPPNTYAVFCTAVTFWWL
jgi:hypothetical protein